MLLLLRRRRRLTSSKVCLQHVNLSLQLRLN